MKVKQRSLVPLIVVVAALLVASCHSVSTDGDWILQPAQPDEPASGEALSTLVAGDTSFTLHRESAKCLAVDIDHPGLQTTVERGCFDENTVVRQTESCGWSGERGATDELDGFDCDFELPTVFFGQNLTASAEYMCVGRWGESANAGVVGATLLEQSDEGLVFQVAAPDESGPAHFLTAGGHRWGDPPLDAPSDPIYAACEALVAGRELPEEFIYTIDVIVGVDPSLADEDVVVELFSGVDGAGFHASAMEPGESFPLPLRASSLVPYLDIDVRMSGEDVAGWRVEWPTQVMDLLRSGVECSGLTIVEVHATEAIIEGDRNSLTLRYGGSECSAAKP